MDTENDVLDHLTKKHREVEDLIAKLKETGPNEEREELLEELTESLLTHMAVEERFIYPIASRTLGSEEAEDASDEHELVRGTLEAVGARVVGGAFEAALEILEEGIAHHVQDEEEEMFPKLRETAADEIARLDPHDLEDQVKAAGQNRADAWKSGSLGGAHGDGTASGDRSEERTREELYEAAKEADVAGRSTMTKDELAEALDSD